MIDERMATARGWSRLAELTRAHMKPAPRLKVSVWSESNIVLPDTSAEPGPIRFERTPYLREIVDCASDPMTRRVVWRKPAQVGGSTALLCVLGYYIDQDPAPILLVQISTGEAEKFSKERVAPLIAASDSLASKVSDPRTRNSGNTIDSKSFTGGHLGIVGANAPSGLRSRPRRVGLFDEIDGYPPSAGAEGDPLELARKRMSTFWNRMEMDTSTPTLKELSRIEAALEECDEVRDYHVPCPHCDQMQELRWGGPGAPYGVKWDRVPLSEARPLREGDVIREGDVHRTSSAAYLCESCGTLIHERFKVQMIRDVPAGGKARWIAADPHPRPTRIGFRMNALYSPWVSWAEVALEFLQALGNPLKMQVWVNTRLGEPWDQAGDTVKAAPLMARREDYAPEPLPERVVLLTAGVDVQINRLEVEIVGWAPGEESWSIEYLQLLGDPTTGKVWGDLDRLLERGFAHPYGANLRIYAMCVDAGYLTQEVQKFTGERLDRNVWAVKGIDGPGRPIISRPSLRTRRKVPQFPIGTDAAKSQLYGRLAIERPDDWGGEPIPGYCHFPVRERYDEEYFRQLTSEKVVLRQTAGNQLKRLWIRKPGRLAEGLDCRVYAIAALEGLIAMGVRLEQLAEHLKPDEEEGDHSVEDDAPSSSWAYGWKS